MFLGLGLVIGFVFGFTIGKLTGRKKHIQFQYNTDNSEALQVMSINNIHKSWMMLKELIMKPLSM